jgi:carbonic anhydrase/acetyltransferase-like protein (isoleucine patch superfamily)
MLIEHLGKRPTIDPTAHIAPNAVVCGDVTIGPNSLVLFGAVVTAETGPIEIGEGCVIMEQAVVRGTKRHPTRIGNAVLVGPHSHLTGCTIEDNVFVATGSSIFNGAVVETCATVRINGIVHIGSRLPAGTSMPIGYIAIGDPAELYPPSEGEQVLAALAGEKFSETVFGIERTPDDVTVMPALSRRYTAALAAHADDRVIG